MISEIALDAMNTPSKLRVSENKAKNAQNQSSRDATDNNKERRAQDIDDELEAQLVAFGIVGVTTDYEVESLIEIVMLPHDLQRREQALQIRNTQPSCEKIP